MLLQIICSTPVTQRLFSANICLTCEESAAAHRESFKFHLSAPVVNSD